MPERCAQGLGWVGMGWGGAVCFVSDCVYVLLSRCCPLSTATIVTRTVFPQTFCERRFGPCSAPDKRFLSFL